MLRLIKSVLQNAHRKTSQACSNRAGNINTFEDEGLAHARDTYPELGGFNGQVTGQRVAKNKRPHQGLLHINWNGIGGVAFIKGTDESILVVLVLCVDGLR